MQLHNKYDRETLIRKIEEEPFDRVTVSFYRYVEIEDPEKLRDELFREWHAMRMLGRVYIAKEGINAQISIPEYNFETLKENLDFRKEFKKIPLKKAVEDSKESFLKLIIKIRDQIVADGLHEGTYDFTNVGKHLNAKEFNEALDDPNTIVVDMRNHYESEVGHFEGAILPEAETFHEELPLVKDKLKGSEDKKILMYCTGGIRCEKASAYLKHHGFKDVNQLHGGIIAYAHQVKQQELASKYIGKNFVFDDRIGERITDEVIAECHQCGKPCDTHVNCANVGCNLLFIQCDECAEKYEGCCTPKCQEINKLPEDAQLELRKSTVQKKRFNKGMRQKGSLKETIAQQEREGFDLNV